jgi:hypothetical protein
MNAQSLARFASLLTFAALVAGCNGAPAPECSEFDQVFVYTDADGDGYGIDDPIGYVCEPGPNQATNTVDCDDTNPAVAPGAEEVCDDLDNDCNGAIDESQPKVPYYKDSDGDGFGSVLPADQVVACAAPTGYIAVSGDCDDANPEIKPSQREICNGGIDDDCDGAADDDDGSVDPLTRVRYYADLDGDTWGDSENFRDLCLPPPSGAVLDDGDCDDGNAAIHPDAIEECNKKDDDCDTLIDDNDPSVDIYTQTWYYDDADGDGFGDPTTLQRTCMKTVPGVLDGTDCDDTDATVHVVQDWNKDVDKDGWGGTVQVTQCDNPGGGLIPASAGVDCNDGNAAIHPTAAEICADGVDQDCSGEDQCPTCEEWLLNAPGSPDGVYAIDPVSPGQVEHVWCDMTTDGGGWTLVASSYGGTLDDAATAVAYEDLATLEPVGPHNTVWNGLRGLSASSGDIRFACKTVVANPTFDVDLSFYDIRWYPEITQGTDLQSCFNEKNGAGADYPPARRNNVTGDFLDLGDQWSAGFLEGEDTCGDAADFTVDFDDRGMGGNPNDGTDWGEANGTPKCGTVGGEAWFIFYREP